MMEMNDANGFADWEAGTRNGSASSNRPAYRHDDGRGTNSAAVKVPFVPEPLESVRWARIEQLCWLALGLTMVVFSAFPIVNFVKGLSTKDYGLWYQVGL